MKSNHRISLKYIFFCIILLGTFFPLSNVSAQEETPADIVFIASLTGGEAVQGLVQVTGTINVAGFQSYELYFSSTAATSGAAFLIQRSSQPVIEGIIGEWDTSILTDGDYNLYLLVTTDDAPVEIFVDGLRVRNYSSIETSTPTPTVLSPTGTPAIVETPIESITQEVVPSPTPFPENPASVQPNMLRQAIIKGAITGLAVFALFGLYLFATRPK